MAQPIPDITVAKHVIVDELRLRRFARLAAGLLRGTAAQGIGPRAAHNRAGPGLEFLDLRLYAPGDDLRHVDWRQSSRHRQPMVRRYRDESASDWLLGVDGSASMSLGGKWRQAAELASALAYALIYAGHRVALAIFAERIHTYCPRGRGQRQFGAILRQLMDYEPPERGGESLPGLCAESVTSAGNVILFSDFLREDAMADDLRRLRAGVSSARALQVLGKDELTVRASGPARLLDVESGDERRLALSPATRAAADNALHEHNGRLRQVLASLGMPFSACRVGDDWERVLVAHLRA
jgi:uncharacterized protein (DUF58 family)